jgi:DNA-binding NtrC family response regulator
LCVGDPERREQLSAVLVALGHEVLAASDPRTLFAEASGGATRLAIVDNALVSSTDAAWWASVRRSLPGLSVVVLSEPGGPLTDAGGWVQGGASGEVAALTSALEPVLAAAGAPGARRRSSRWPAPLDPFVGESKAIRQLAVEARQALCSESPVLIEGETGTGKGVLAAWLHRHGPRARRPFVDLNCAGFSRELMDAELFGHEKGAFTGAVSAKPGLLEVADGGTLFLDEIGDMEVAIQAKLLKVIEEHRYRRVGDTRERQSDVRIVVATHHHLLDRVRADRFREDLYYRVSVLPLRMPAVRERTCDIPQLSRCILDLVVPEGRSERGVLTPAAERALLTHPWPGNLRELRNALERACLACEGARIDVAHLGLDREALPAAPAAASRTKADPYTDLERTYIERVLGEEHYRVDRTAERLGIPRSTFYQKLRTLGIPTRRTRLGLIESS